MEMIGDIDVGRTGLCSLRSDVMGGVVIAPLEGKQGQVWMCSLITSGEVQIMGGWHFGRRPI